MAQTPKDVVIACFNYLKEVSPNSDKISQVRIEELEQAEEETSWTVVLSYDVTGEFPFDRTRQFKEFKVSDENAEVLSMKIKNI